MSEALSFCQTMRDNGKRFVTMVSENVDHVGKLGVAAVDDNYEWSKEYSIKNRKRQLKMSAAD